MEFNCELCNYSTKDKSNYNKHIISQRHLEIAKTNILENKKADNEIKTNNNNTGKQYICDFCKAIYKFKSGYNKHVQVCKNINDIEQNKISQNTTLIIPSIGKIDTKTLDAQELLLKRINQLELQNEKEKNYYKNKIEQLEQENKFLNQQLHLNKDKIIEESNNHKDALIDEVTYLRSVANNATIVVSETMNTVNFIINNLTNAPAIEKNFDYKKIIYDNNKEKIDIVGDMVHHYRHNTFVKYIGDIIVRCYKKKDPQQQSIWNSDISRKNYLLREIINKNPEWITDKKGIKTKEILIEPIIAIIENIIKEFLKESDRNEDGSINNFILSKKLEYGIILNEILFSIEHKNLHNDINSYIAQFFYFNKNEFIKLNKIDKKLIKERTTKKLK